jgi:hypothetical protein
LSLGTRNNQEVTDPSQPDRPEHSNPGWRSVAMTLRRFMPFVDRVKPEKPHLDFPLFAHQYRCWAKKIRGKPHYSGPWEDPDAALTTYLAEKDARAPVSGREPRHPDVGQGGAK